MQTNTDRIASTKASHHARDVNGGMVRNGTDCPNAPSDRENEDLTFVEGVVGLLPGRETY